MTFLRRSLFLALAAATLLGWGYRNATTDPVLRETHVALRDWPEGEAPLRALVISDIHVAGPDMPPSRLTRIVGRINALDPDLVLIAGDFVGDKSVATRSYSLTEAVAPLAGLRPRLGTFAVLGNHDHWRDAAETRRALRAVKVVVLDNDAVSAGPLAIGGLDDPFTHHDRLAATLRRLRTVPGARILLSHSPDPFPDVPSDIGLMLAGHTHCGQIRLPLIGALSTMSDYGDRYACGRINEAGKVLIVGAGLGTSILPLRLGAPPDMWLVALGPTRARS
jgi:predicted MPP superfamily phosphohydrolase